MNRTIKVGFVGAGRRMQEFYMPVIKGMSKQNIEPVGFVTRTDTTADQASRSTGLKRYAKVADLAKDVDMLIVCVNAQGMSAASMAAMDTSCTVLLETPVTDEAVARRAYERQYLTGAAEQWPFRPMEVFRRLILQSGTMGRINAVQNNFRGYEYHAIAMMRAYSWSFERRAYPTALMGMSFSSGPVELVDSTGNQKTLVENWDIATINLDDDTKLIHTFNSVHSRSRSRGPRSLNVLCQRGALCADDTNWIEFVESIAGHPVTVDVSVLKEDDANAPHTLRCSVSGEVHEWVNPFAKAKKFDEQDVAIATILDSMAAATRIYTDNHDIVPYPVHEAYIDWLTVAAMRYSSSVGSAVKFPRPTWMM